MLPIENQRVKEIINFTTKGNELQFSREIGISQPRINRLFTIDKRSGNYPLVSFEIVQAIINKFLNISAEWLLTGKGSMLKSEEKNNQSILGNNNLMSGNDLSYSNNSDIVELLKTQLDNCKKVIEEKDNQINKLLDIVISYEKK